MNQLQNAIANANKVLADSGYELMHTYDASSLCMKRAYETVGRNTPILFPICLNNGYYNAEKINLMMRYLPRFSHRAIIFFTDGPARNNYLAIGKTDVEAEREARLQRNRLRNHCLVGLAEIDDTTFSCEFDNWQDVYSDPHYLEAYNSIERLFQNSAEMKEAVVHDTLRVLARLTKSKTITEEQINTASQYVLQELAYILSATRRWNVKQLVYIYYDHWNVLEKLLNGRYDSKIRNDIAYLMLTLVKLEIEMSA